MDKDDEKMTLGVFIAENIVSGFIFVFVYRVALFRGIGDLTFGMSEVIFYDSFLLLFGAGVFDTARYRRVRSSAWYNTFFPLGLYTAVSYFGELYIYILILAGLALTASAVMLVKWAKKMRGRLLTEKSITGRMITARNIFGLASIVLIAPLLVRTVFFNRMFSPTQESVDPRFEQWTVSQNRAALEPLTDEAMWEELTRDEKFDVMQTMANVNACALGLPHELSVTARPLSEYTLANYNASFHTISFNLDRFDSYTASEALHTLLHESYHAYQRCLVAMYDSTDKTYCSLEIMRLAADYKQEFLHYSHGETDYDSYIVQQVETDAEKYAEVRYGEIMAELSSALAGA